MTLCKTLLSPAQRARFFALPSAGQDLIANYTLSPDDLALINRRRRPQNRLGFAVQLCLMRSPGRALGPGELPPASIVAYIAEQLGLDHNLMRDYARREKTRQEHLVELENVFGGFCISPQKGSFQSYGCKTYRKKKSFCTYVLQQQKWRKSGLRPAVA